MIRTLAVTAALALVAANGWAQQTSAHEATWKVGGDTRRGIVYAPSAPPQGTKLPVVFAFHGRGDDTQNFQFVGLHRAWSDAIVVYFQGLDNRGLSGWQGERGQDNDRDLKLVDAALAALRKTYAVDDDRVYATGFSNGAAFTFLLWAERPNTFAAYAVVAGRLRPAVQPKQPRPILHVAGVADPQIAYADQRAAIVSAIAINGARSQTDRCGNGCTIYGGGSTTPVVTWIHQGGHEFPRGTSERIAAFFQDHPREK
ncbi:MAG: PHB depolymerase family esterase [Vicinamibacterales bacterium]